MKDKYLMYIYYPSVKDVNDLKNIKIINICFLIIFLSVIYVGFIKPIIKPIDVNYAENRTANKLPVFSFSVFLDKSFQDQYEAAIADQLPLSSKMKKAEKTLELITKLNYFEMNDAQFHKIDSGLLYKDNYLIYTPRDFGSIKEKLDQKIMNLNETVDRLSNVSFNLYYIEKDTDMNFETGDRLQVYEYMKDKLNQRISTEKYAIDSFEEFQSYFYQSDHHWNHKGSYQAYGEIVRWLGDEEPIQKSDEICMNTTFSGSKAAGIGGSALLKEQMCAYRFVLKPHDIYINGKAADRYGNYMDYFEVGKESGSYSDFYGGDAGLLEFDYHQEDKENLLMIGESYDNAINELLASHFNHTYNVDLRNYERENGKPFNLDAFVKEHSIDRILLIGNIDYYVMEEFNLKGGN